ncbi:hypothetical protein [Streptosporangium sp. CA-115845]|uniref:hypothetical protein n=1 Tax=Streptosporangium sp. CA-115845 TaxID=3240071 RepID=UPI003D93F42E
MTKPVLGDRDDVAMSGGGALPRGRGPARPVAVPGLAENRVAGRHQAPLAQLGSEVARVIDEFSISFS